MTDRFCLYQGVTASGRPFAMILHASGDDGKFDRVVCEVERDRDTPQQYDRFISIYAPIMVSALEAEMGHTPCAQPKQGKEGGEG